MKFIERTFIKLAYLRVEKKMQKLKTWGPLIGSLALICATVLRTIGQTEAAGAVEGIAGATGLTAQSPVQPAEMVAAAAALVGVVLKLRSAVQAARAKAASESAQ